MDRMLLRYILSAHSKVQKEFLYLETGAIPLGHVITTRRMTYLQTILKHPQGELIREVYEAQKINSVKGDWVELVKQDFDNVDMILNEKEIQESSKSEYKLKVKYAVNQCLFKELKTLQEGHSKISHVCYKQFETQSYMKNHILNNHEVSLLFALRSRTASAFKANFPYNVEQLCPLGCPDLDSQEHCLLCNKLMDSRNSSVVYENIFSENITKQSEAVILFATLLERREEASALITGPSHGPVQDNFYYIISCVEIHIYIYDNF